MAVWYGYGRMRNETGFQYYSNGRKLLSRSRNVKNFGNKMTFVRKGRQAKGFLSTLHVRAYTGILYEQLSFLSSLLRNSKYMFYSVCVCLFRHILL